jgi:hypothetical protein
MGEVISTSFSVARGEGGEGIAGAGGNTDVTGATGGGVKRAASGGFNSTGAIALFALFPQN